jgi:serine/threonine protein kinase
MSDPKMIGRQIGNYIITQKLSEGGMGSVFVAEHPQLERRVAIKILSSNFSDSSNISERFLVEAKVIAKLRHPNIIDCSDFGMVDGRPYYVMELLEGVDLKEVMSADKKMACAKAAPFIRQTAAALQAAHEAGIVHRDLKPANIFVEYATPPRVRLLDFGIAKLLDVPGNSVSMTNTGLVIGTPSTMAPEQAAGLSAEIGPHTDIYSLGVIIYWMLAGRPPFKAKSAAVLLAKHITDVPVPLSDLRPDVPAAISELIDRCLAKTTSDRPTHAQEVARIFDEAIGDDTVQEIGDLPAAPKTAPVGSFAKTQPPNESNIAHQPTHSSLPSANDVAMSHAETASFRGKEQDAHHTTLGQAVGETMPKAPSAPAGARWGTLLMVAAVSVSVALFAVLSLQGSGNKKDVEEVNVGAARPLPVNKATLPEKAPQSPPVQRRVLVINIKDPGGHCRVSIDGRSDQSQRAPCRFELARGIEFKLEVGATGLKPYRSRFKLTKDQIITMLADGKGALIQQTKPDGSDADVRPEQEVATKISPPAKATSSKRNIGIRPKVVRPKAKPTGHTERKPARSTSSKTKARSQGTRRATKSPAAKMPVPETAPKKKNLGDTLPGEF